MYCYYIRRGRKIIIKNWIANTEKLKKADLTIKTILYDMNLLGNIFKSHPLKSRDRGSLVGRASNYEPEGSSLVLEQPKTIVQSIGGRCMLKICRGHDVLQVDASLGSATFRSSKLRT